MLAALLAIGRLLILHPAGQHLLLVRHTGWFSCCGNAGGIDGSGESSLSSLATGNGNE
jgi:hypothetical protein